MDYSLKTYWILFSIGSCGYCFHSISNQNAKKVVEGTSLDLTCHFSSDVVHCTWNRLPEELFSSTTSRKPEYIVYGNNTNGECHLRINNANIETDNGVWICQMTTANKVNISCQINLTVLPRDYVSIKGDAVVSRPGVFVGAFCAILFTLGGLITIYVYKKKSPCCLAPAGYTSRSMLVWNASPESRSEDLTSGNENEM